jgi:hypothetical protein
MRGVTDVWMGWGEQLSFRWEEPANERVGDGGIAFACLVNGIISHAE